jgi:hypothetical protein
MMTMHAYSSWQVPYLPLPSVKYPAGQIPYEAFDDLEIKQEQLTPFHIYSWFEHTAHDAALYCIASVGVPIRSHTCT